MQAAGWQGDGLARKGCQKRKAAVQCSRPLNLRLPAPPQPCTAASPPPTPLQVPAGSAVCHDVTSLLAVQFPFAAPKPASCDAPIAVTSLTSLLAYGKASSLTAAALLEAFSLPPSFALLSSDALKVGAASLPAPHLPACVYGFSKRQPALPLPPHSHPAATPACLQGAGEGNAQAREVYRREVQAAGLTLAAAKFLTKHSERHPAARVAMLKAVASRVMGSGRRRLLATATGMRAVPGVAEVHTLHCAAWPHPTVMPHAGGPACAVPPASLTSSLCLPASPHRCRRPDPGQHPRGPRHPGPRHCRQLGHHLLCQAHRPHP